MTTQLDFSVGMTEEVLYGSPLPPTRFFEVEGKFTYDVKTVQGKGLRPTKGVARASRRSISRYEGQGEMSVEVATKGFGLLLGAVFGASTNTAVTTTTGLFQQVHTLSKTDPVKSFTIQQVIPFLGGGAGQPHTFSGCVADSLTLDAKEGAILEAKISWLAQKMFTTSPAAVASYPSGDGLFTFVHGAIVTGATLTAPTSTALATLPGEPLANIADFSLSVKRGLDTSGWNLGGAGYRSRKNVLGHPEITGKLTAEYTDNKLRDAYLQQTPLALLLTFTHDDGKSALQVVLPCIMLNGEVPTSNGGDPVTQSIDFDVLDNGVAAEPIWVVYRTTDTTP